MIGFAMCGSYCTHKYAIEQLKMLISNGYDVLPIMSENVYNTDTRFGKASELIEVVSSLCGRSVIHPVVGAEPIGPSMTLDAMIICPCTGNTLANMELDAFDYDSVKRYRIRMKTYRPGHVWEELEQLL